MNPIEMILHLMVEFSGYMALALFIISIVLFLVALVRQDEEEKANSRSMLFVSIWFASTAWAKTDPSVSDLNAFIAGFLIMFMAVWFYALHRNMD